ncbi:hypothetical protein Fot_20139 [Forsythia ovata]|uniref:DUF4378 domain-containing protein n=1 Tax=Forsythia ovata TaxID=205694 RepID=A0ABD1VPQ1_9LAMI
MLEMKVDEIQSALGEDENAEVMKAEIKRLRTRLAFSEDESCHLLKTESEAYAQVPALISNQEEVAQQSQLGSEENQILRAGSWEVSYFIDVLIDSGFEEADPDMLGRTWYAPKCLLHPAVFDNLEKKYSEETTVSRAERRLLLDRIYSSLLEFLEQHVD